jgi:GNAT superfamily N-acetyltransferase
MAWTLTQHVETYLANAGEFLRSRAAENTIILGAVETLQARGMNAFGDPAPLFGWWPEPADAVTAAFMHTPPFPVTVTAMPPQVAADLAGTLAARGRFLPGVNAEAGAAAAFAAAWQALTGQSSQVRLRMRMYRLGKLTPPDPAPPGRARLARPADKDLLVAWLAAFDEEAAPGPRTDSGKLVDDRLSYGGLTLWEHDDVPVSLAGLLRPTSGQVRVGPVYTPPRWRGRGFASAVTATVSQAALAAGVGEVLLFTDLANPTSNALYQRLGFQPVADRVTLGFARA